MSLVTELCAAGSNHTASRKCSRITQEEKSRLHYVSWVFRSLGQDPMLAALVVWCGRQEVTLRVMLEKLIPKVVQSEEAPITEKTAGCVRDNDEKRPWQIEYPSRLTGIWFWGSKLDASEEQRRIWLLKNQSPVVLRAARPIHVASKEEVSAVIR